MRILGSTILVLAIVFAAAPVRAQTYPPGYPVCMKLYGGHFGGGEWNDCSYVSLSQCQASASGRPAMCVMNPNFAYAQTPPARSYRRPYGRY
jgi:hypothetical protein